MAIKNALLVAAGLQLAGALRKSSSKSLAGVPILNYRYRHMQTSVQDGSYEWVLKFSAGVSDAEMAAFCDAGECQLMGHPSQGGLPMATVRATEAKLQKLLEANVASVEWVEPDTPVDLEPESEEVMESSSQDPWGLEKIGRQRASFTGKGTRIYVMDTGIRSTHQDFGGRAIPTVDTLSNSGRVVECDPSDMTCAADTRGHGTHVAGTAGGNRYGVATGATLHSMRVCCGSGSNILGGMDWITVNNRGRPAVMTMSLGSYSTPESSRVAVDAVVNAGITVTVSAGNRNYPSCDKSYTFIRSAIGVGASDETNTRASFSNYGECNAIFAPGVRTISASHTSDTGATSKSGTSMAAPMVAGATAMLLEQDPSLSPEKIRNTLRNRSAKDVLASLRTGDPNMLLYVGN